MLLIIDLIGGLLFGLAAGAVVAAILIVLEITLSIIEEILSELIDEERHKITPDVIGISVDLDEFEKLVAEKGVRKKLNVTKNYARIQALVDGNGKIINGKVVESDVNKVKEKVIQYEL